MKINTLILLIICIKQVSAYNYGEHELIGNAAMNLFYNQLHNENTDKLSEYLPFQCDSISKTIIFSTLSKFQLPIGYGTINALSGDHSENPLHLEEQLLTLNSDLLKVINAHNTYINQYYSGAPNGKLTKLDGHFATLALKNLSHFYEYGKGIKAHIRDFEVKNIEKALSPSSVNAVFKKLHGTNAISMYLTVHTTAIHLAELAGIEAKKGNTDAKKYLYYAFLYNGFADHFLEDAFSGGHLLVKRTLLASAVNNKSLHDFYCKYGTDVVNLKGEIWKAYGDDFYNQHHSAYLNKKNLVEIEYPSQTTETQRVTDAVFLSLQDLKEGFKKGMAENNSAPIFCEKIPHNLNEKLTFFLNNYKALSLIPLPYNTKLRKIMPDTLYKNKNIKSVNQMPYLRNYVRSRIANSFVIGLTNSYLLKSEYLFKGTDLRLNFGLFSSQYKLNSSNRKAGVMDMFHGYTISYSSGRILNKPQNIFKENWIIKGGIRSNFDFWISNKRFLGIYTYNEIGFENRNSTGAIVYVPQIGLQLGSLLNINYYNKPYLLRIPMQLLLPLKFRVGCIISSKNQPTYFSGAEIDVLF